MIISKIFMEEILNFLSGKLLFFLQKDFSVTPRFVWTGPVKSNVFQSQTELS